MEFKNGLAAILAAGAVVACLILSGKQAQNSEQAEAQAYAQAAMWPALPRQQALILLEKYGLPQRISEDRMEWDGQWPWKRVAVSEDQPLSALTETVSCRVPQDKLDDLARYSYGLTADARLGELSASSGSEALNFLSLNLGMDILTGGRTPEDASRYFDHAVGLHYAGKSVPYMERLFFDVPLTRRMGLP